MSDENVKIVRGIYEAAGRGDIEAVVATFDEGVVLHEAASLPYGGSYHGIPQFLQAFGRIVETLGPFEFDIEAVLGADEGHVLVLVNLRGTAPATGKPYSLPLAELWKLREGKVIEIRPFYWDTAALLQSLQ